MLRQLQLKSFALDWVVRPCVMGLEDSGMDRTRAWNLAQTAWMGWLHRRHYPFITDHRSGVVLRIERGAA